MGLRQNLAEANGDAVVATRKQAAAALEDAALLQQEVPDPVPVPPALLRLASGTAPKPTELLPSSEQLQRLLAEEAARQQALEQAVAGWLAAHHDTNRYKEALREENARLLLELQQLLAGTAEEPAEAAPQLQPAAPAPALPAPATSATIQAPAGPRRRNRDRKPRRGAKTAPV